MAEYKKFPYRRAGLEAILVLTGTANEGDLASAEHQPDLVLAGLAALAVVAESNSGSRQPLRGRG